MTTPHERAEAVARELDRRAIGEHWVDGPHVGNYVNRCPHGFGNHRNCHPCLTDALLSHAHAEVERVLMGLLVYIDEQSDRTSMDTELPRMMTLAQVGDEIHRRLAALRENR